MRRKHTSQVSVILASMQNSAQFFSNERDEISVLNGKVLLSKQPMTTWHEMEEKVSGIARLTQNNPAMQKNCLTTKKRRCDAMIRCVIIMTETFVEYENKNIFFPNAYRQKWQQQRCHMESNVTPKCSSAGWEQCGLKIWAKTYLNTFSDNLALVYCQQLASFVIARLTQLMATGTPEACVVLSFYTESGSAISSRWTINNRMVLVGKSTGKFFPSPANFNKEEKQLSSCGWEVCSLGIFSLGFFDM